MDIGNFFSSLAAAIAARLSSVGASVAAGFATIVMSFTADEREILADVKKVFHDKYQELVSGGANTLDAIEGAGTAAWNTFCDEEGKEFRKEADATITLLVSSAKSAANLKQVPVAPSA